jgi:hypothetical protein
MKILILPEQASPWFEMPAAKSAMEARVNRVAVVGSELLVGGWFVFARPFIEFVPLYCPRVPATFQIAVHNSLPKLIRRGGEIVSFDLRTDLPSSIAKGIPLFPGPNSFTPDGAPAVPVLSPA